MPDGRRRHGKGARIAEDSRQAWTHCGHLRQIVHIVRDICLEMLPGRNTGGGVCSSPDGRADLPDGRSAAGMAMPPSDNGGIGI
jgi:hypothetical protein